MLVSTVQHSESVIHISLFLGFPSHFVTTEHRVESAVLLFSLLLVLTVVARGTLPSAGGRGDDRG